MTEAEVRYAKHRNKYVPQAIGATFAKLEALLVEAERRGLPFHCEWRERADELRSRFLTDPDLINREWERAVGLAKNSQAEEK